MYKSKLNFVARRLAQTAIIAFCVGFATVALLSLCGCMSENTGSSTIVGEQLALPEITDSSDSVAVRVYESIKGARVWTARDSKVTIAYTNTYTNKYFGIVETQDSMNLTVDIEPLDCSGEPEDTEPSKEQE